MHDTIPEGRGADHARLGIINMKGSIFARPIAAAVKFTLQLKKVFLKFQKKFHHIWSFFFALRGIPGSAKKIFKGYNFIKQILKCLHVNRLNAKAGISFETSY